MQNIDTLVQEIDDVLDQHTREAVSRSIHTTATGMEHCIDENCDCGEDDYGTYGIEDLFVPSMVTSYFTVDDYGQLVSMFDNAHQLASVAQTNFECPLNEAYPYMREEAVGQAHLLLCNDSDCLLELSQRNKDCDVYFALSRHLPSPFDRDELSSFRTLLNRLLNKLLRPRWVPLFIRRYLHFAYSRVVSI